MKEITTREEEVMRHFWSAGALFVKQIVDMYPDPKPHFNTISTYVRSLEEKGYLNHEALGTTFRYFPVISEEEYKKGNLGNVLKKYFDSSYLNVVSTFIREDKITVDEVKRLLEEVEKQSKE